MIASFLKTADDWYVSTVVDDETAEAVQDVSMIGDIPAATTAPMAGDSGDDKELKASFFALFMVFACVFSAFGLAMAVFRFWELKSALGGKTRELEKLLNTPKRSMISNSVHFCTWTAVIIFLLGLAMLSLGVHDDDDVVSWFGLAVFWLALWRFFCMLPVAS